MSITAVIKSKYSLWLFAITVNNWILALIFNPKLLYHRGSISDFSALSQPHHYVFRSLDILAGLLIILICFVLFRLQQKQQLGKIIALGGVAFGIFNIIDALVPLPCTNILDKACSVPATLDINHLVLPRHIYSSVAIGFCILLLPLASWLYAKRLASMRLRLVSIFAALAAVLFIIFLGLGSFYENRAIEDIAVYMQYSQMIILGWWFIEWADMYEIESNK